MCSLARSGTSGAPRHLAFFARTLSRWRATLSSLEKLLAEVRRFPPERRAARYRCALAFMRSPRDPSPVICQASWEGRIVDVPRGTGGFGYDPIFELPGRGVTAAEIPAAEKHRLSHRGQALRALVELLAQEKRTSAPAR